MSPTGVPQPNRGRLITLEGGEGAGKTTQQRRLAAHLEARGIETVLTREPGGTPGAEQIRALVTGGAVDRWSAMTELLLMMAARSDHLDRVVRPALDAGRWVVSDRFHDSSRVYQGLAGGLGLEVVDRLHAPLLGSTLPDLTLLLDLDPRVGRERRRAQGGGGRFEDKHDDYHDRVRAGFLALARAEPRRFAVVDAARAEDEVAIDVIDALRRLDPQPGRSAE